MNIAELQRALRQLRLGGMAAVLETRLHQAQAEPMAPIDLISCLISDELTRRADRLLERRRKQAGFRDANRDARQLRLHLQSEDEPQPGLRSGHRALSSASARTRLFLGPGGTGKSHLAQAIGQSAILQGYRVFYRETHILLDELADAVAEGKRKQYLESLATVPLLIIDDFGMRKLPLTAAEDLLEIVMRRYERASTLLTSNRPVEDWGKLLGDTAAVSSMLDRLLHHGHVLKCGPRSWRTKAIPASAHDAAIACGSKEVDRPLSRFPLRGKAGGRPPPLRHGRAKRRRQPERWHPRAAAPRKELPPPSWLRPASCGLKFPSCRKLSRQGKNMACPGCVLIGRFWGDHHWPDLR